MSAKRIRLYRVGVETIDGRIIESDSWREGRLPVLMLPPSRALTGHEGARIVGYVDNRRIDTKTGWVTGLVHVPFSLTGWAAEADFDHIDVDEERSNEDLLVVKYARLMAITLGTNPTWAGMVN